MDEVFDGTGWLINAYACRPNYHFAVPLNTACRHWRFKEKEGGTQIELRV
jgi:hypothetical protein